jgi:hypothetical protein
VCKIDGYIKLRHTNHSTFFQSPGFSFFDLIERDNFLETSGGRMVDNITNRQELCVAIEAAIHIAGNLLNKKVNIISQVFTGVPLEKFFHGYCVLEGHPVPLLILYCADLQVGILAFMGSNDGTNFSRFSLAKVEDFKNKH